MKKLITKILVANRGEIACRIIRSARKLGIRTVAVYSEVDKNALNVLMSDEAYCIGEAASRESYLNHDKIIDVAKQSQCEAIHPGYGFLSENAVFAEYCGKNDIIFIGPPASAIHDMGVKSKSKEIMMKADVPVIPGYHGSEQSNSFLESRALEIGFPLMIKAVHGGGGKGMRVVTKGEDFIPKLESARRESQNSFGDQNVLLEKFIVAPRHIEFQIFADRYGNCVHLNERDCSVQRRHQKVIEEAPAPRIDSNQRAVMGSAAVRAAKAVNYEGAGTVEFIYDEANRTFYFMEMNTRLQVEHPITEMITGTDLVEWQIKIASGEALPMKQNDIPIKGHAVEARIYAEDPHNEFLPCAGPLVHFDPPSSDESIRVETGVREGDDVSVHYDPMLAKLVAWGEDRNQAFTKLRNKLLEFNITGLTTNINFLIALCGNTKLLNGEVNTTFIDENKTELLGRLQPSAEIIAQAIVGLILWEKKIALEKMASTGNPYNPFVTESGFRLNHEYERCLKLYSYDGNVIDSKITYKESGLFNVQVNGKNYDLSGYLIEDGLHKVQLITNFEDRVSKSKIFVQDEEFVHLFTLDGSFCFKIWSPKFGANSSENLAKDAVAPMPGIVSNIFVKPGDKVVVGDPLLVIIAMKMEHIVKSPKDGIVKNIFFEVGQNISKNALVAKLEAQ